MNCGLAWEINIVFGSSAVYGLVVRLLFLKLGMFVIVSWVQDGEMIIPYKSDVLKP